jgi:hypothetical protein
LVFRIRKTDLSHPHRSVAVPALTTLHYVTAFTNSSIKRVRRRHYCRPLPKEPSKRLSPQTAQAQLKHHQFIPGRARLHKTFANAISLVHPIAETRALNCTILQSLPSFPTSNLKYGPATAAPGGSQRLFGLGQSSNPYPFHYRAAFAFSAFSYPLPNSFPRGSPATDSMF